MNQFITPEFYAETLPIVEEMMSRDDAEKFFKMMDDLEVTVWPRPSEINFYHPDMVRRFALIFATTLKLKTTRQRFWQPKKRFRSYDPQTLYTIALTLTHRDSESIFENLSLECQKFYIELGVDRGSHYIYLRLLRQMGFPPTHRIFRFEKSKFGIHEDPEDAHTQIRNFIAGLVSQSSGKDTSALDFSYPTDDFVAVIRKESPLWESFYATATEIFFLFRVVYGEDTVLDFIRTVGVDEDRLTHDNILEIIDNWSDVKHYPVEWMLTMIPESPEIRDYMDLFP